MIHQYKDDLVLLSTKKETVTDEPLAKITRLIGLATKERKWAAAVVPDIIFDR